VIGGRGITKRTAQGGRGEDRWGGKQGVCRSRLRGRGLVWRGRGSGGRGGNREGRI